MRKGMALPSVLIFLVLVIPLVFTLSMRSRSTLRWVATTEYHFRALLLAQEGETEVRESLRAGTVPTAGNRGVPGGGMEFQLRSLPPGDLGQPFHALAAEGTFHGEESLVFALIEDFQDPPGSHLLIESDRSWSHAGPGGAATTTLDTLLEEHGRKNTEYLDNLARERSQSSTQFLNVMETSSRMLDTPDVEESWSAISGRLQEAKVR